MTSPQVDYAPLARAIAEMLAAAWHRHNGGTTTEGPEEDMAAPGSNWGDQTKEVDSVHEASNSF